jgi:hypothetical protein
MTAHTPSCIIARFTHSGCECVKWTQSRDARTITGYSFLEEPHESFSPQTVQRLRSILAEFKYDKDKDTLLVVLPHSRVTSQYLRLPSLRPDEISSMVNLQAVKLFPAGQSLVTGTRIIDKEARGSSMVNAVLAQDETVKSILNTLTDAGAVVENVYLDIYGYEALISQPSGNKGLLFLINIENDFCQAAVLKDTKVCVSRGFFVSRSVAGWQEKLVAQVIETQSQYLKQEGSSPIKTVCLAVPDPAQRQEYLAFFREHLPQEVAALSLENASSISCRINMPGFPERIMGLLGFMLRLPDPSLSLLPMHVQKRRAESRVARHGVRVILTAVLAALLFSAAGARLISQKKAYLARLEKEMSALKKESASVESMALKMKVVREISKEKGNVLDFLTAVHQVAPGGMMLEELSYDAAAAEQYSVYGYSTERDSVFAFATKLGEYAVFASQAEVKYADRVDSPDGELIKFKIAFARK